MSNKKRGKTKELKNVLHVKQKYTLKYVIAGGSILMILAAFFVYFNFGASETSKAKGAEKTFVISYKTTDLNVPGLLLVDEPLSERTTFNNYKSKPKAKKHFKSDADSVKVEVKIANQN